MDSGHPSLYSTRHDSIRSRQYVIPPTIVNQELNSQLIATSDIFALIILYLSKCCVIAIYLRLTPQKPHNRASWATLALCTAWLIPAIFILLINCELSRPWRTHGGQCPNLVGTRLLTTSLAHSNNVYSPNDGNSSQPWMCSPKSFSSHSPSPY